MSDDEKETRIESWLVSLVAIVFVIGFAMYASGQPQGANILGNSTEPQPTSNPPSRSDDGGTITFLNLSTAQQNSGWKAYVGNVTGSLTLDDASGNTIYDWALTSNNLDGEVYVSRNQTIEWSSIGCANTSTLNSENSFLGYGGSADNLTNTFSATAHQSMIVGDGTANEINISQDSCRSTATYVNDSSQTVDENASFQEILLQDSSSALVYSTFIEQDADNYKTDNSTYDFQMIVGDASATTYYFYLEVSG